MLAAIKEAMLNPALLAQEYVRQLEQEVSPEDWRPSGNRYRWT